MKLPAHFDHFLASEVNLNQSRIDTIDARLAAVQAFLGQHADLGAMLAGDLIPQGSFAQKTIIKPLPGHDFDVDVLLPMHVQDGFEALDYIANVYAALRSSGTYREMTNRGTRCVTVTYANEFHIDIVPFLERDGALWITNRQENSYELSNPERFNEWLDEHNRTASLHLVPAIRILKYLRDYKETFTAKSIVLTTLLGAQVHSARLLGDPEYYIDVPTALLHIVGDLDEYLQATPQMPVIPDPGGTGDDFSQRWDETQYSNFRNRVHSYAEKIRAACEADEEHSLALWQELFGTAFQTPPTGRVALSETARVPSGEQFLDTDFGIPTHLTGQTVHIVGRVARRPGFRDYPLPQRGNRVPKGCSLVFRIDRCDVPAPYQVYWKVRNQGEEAAKAGQLRGEIRLDADGATKRERTLYRGSHYVECFIVKNGACVARDRQPVFIT